MSQGLQAGFSFNEAISQTLTLDINTALRSKVLRWLDGACSGQSVSHAARDAGLPRLLVGMLGAAEVAGGMSDTFEFLARYYENRFSRSLLLLQGAIAPLTALVFGALVCAVALSLFVPMTELLQKIGLPCYKL